MRKVIIVFRLTLVIFFINNNGYSQDSEKIGKTEKVNFEIKKFTFLPKEIDGCACYFYLSKQDEINERYIFVNDFANVAFVFIDKKLEKFKLTKSTTHNTVYYYSNNTYDIVIRILKKKKEESSEMTGLMEVLSKNGSKTINKFVGSCGC